MEEIQFEELTPLDLRKCGTVDDIVRGMSKCSFGARMLGETADTLHGMIERGEKPLVIYDGRPDTPLGKLLQRMAYEKKLFSRVVLPEEYASGNFSEKNVLVVGGYSERHEDAIYEKPERAIFINEAGRARPGQVKDGYFPDVVFTDPRFIVPLLYCSLEERLDGKTRTVKEMLREIRGFGGVASEVSHGAYNLGHMQKDAGCTKFLTLSGAMTIAQMGLVICDMIDEGFVDYIATTGALMAHGLVQGIGLRHYKYRPDIDDETLARMEINRVTDTLEPETNLDHVEEVLNEVFKDLSGEQNISPRMLNEMIGRHLKGHYPGQRGILKSAYERGVPVIVPALVDSEIGNDIHVENMRRKKEGKKLITVVPSLDNDHLIDSVVNAERIGIFSIGGGVPRNNVQNVAPLINIINKRLGLDLPTIKFSYGTRIAPDFMWTGHLSGCTYREGESWGKMHHEGKFAEVHADATLVWPFYVKYLMDLKDSGLMEQDEHRKAA